MTARDASGVPDVPDHPTMLAAIRLGCRAPSVHNTQPWRWVFDGARLHLYSDTDRQLSMDPHGRQLMISCGAVLHHVRTVFAAYNWHTDTVRLPDPRQPRHLAAIEFHPWPDPPAEVRARADAIDHRYTDRLPMLRPDGWDDLVPALRRLVAPHGIELDVLDDSVRSRLVAASEQSTALRRYDMLYQSELHWWTGHTNMPEGIPPSSLISEAEFARVGVGRTFPSVPRSMRRDHIQDQACIVLLSSNGDTLREWVHTGEALSAVLLECAAASLSTCALTHITEVSSGRKLLANLVARAGFPQVLLRVGTAPDADEPTPTPRRSLTDVFTEHRD
ncbi:hypothetical protein AB0B25_21750 [Nocardia sp. NPDC049190]|uniref:Acg family FMN-binding oxidoreductase n=1 Tax=Nocardia sp. NPDC049190 TaxID=3155650 RepID=UPI0033EF0B9F